MTASPTGDQYVLRHADATAVVVELGAALRSFSVGEQDVVDGFGADEPISGGRGQLLAPWPNRITDGSYSWDGQEQRLPLSEPAAGNAIHGLLRWTPYRLVERTDQRVVLAAQVYPQAGYPFHLEVVAEYALGGDGLTASVRARNIGATTAPYGVGHHPYLTAGTPLVDDATLTVPASSWLRTDERGTPVATEPVKGTDYDFTGERRIGTQLVDSAFVDLLRDADGRAVVRLADPAGAAVELELGEGVECVQVYTGDKLPPDARRRGIAVEPMSCPADAFRSGDSLVRLEPGQEHRFSWTLRRVAAHAGRSTIDSR